MLGGRIAPLEAFQASQATMGMAEEHRAERRGLMENHSFTGGWRPPAGKAPTGGKGSEKRLQAGDSAAQDKGMHVMGAFISVYRFQVNHMAHDLVIFLNAIAAVHIA